MHGVNARNTGVFGDLDDASAVPCGGRTWPDIRDNPHAEVKSYACDTGLAAALAARVVEVVAARDRPALSDDDLHVIRSILQPEMKVRGAAGDQDVEGMIARVLGKLG